MKGGLLSLAVSFLLLLPTGVRAESIEAFDVIIDVHKDSALTVNERISYTFTEPRHGIYRTIPTTHPEPASAWYQERYIDVMLESITLDGETVPYTVTKRNKNVEIKIGDPARTISGQHTYEIRYSVRGALTYPKYGGAEVYWNVTGTDWSVPIRFASATLRSSDGFLTRERSCYRGALGEEGSCDRREGSEIEALFSAANLRPGHGMTIAQAVDRTKVERVELERLKSFMLWSLFLAVWFIALGAFVYRYRTALDTTGTVIPQYEPYPGVKPMYSGLLIDGRLDPRDITACIVYLAEQGYLKIRKTEKKVLFFFEVDDYEIELLKPLDETVSAFEQSVLSLLFEHGAVVGTKVSLHTLRHDLEQQQKNHKTIELLKKDLEQDLEESGFFQLTIFSRQIGPILVIIVVVLGALFGILFSKFSTQGVFIAIFLIGSFAILSFIRRRRTLKGYQALDHLKGFKQFLSVTDKERFAFHNAPEKNPQQFMEYLPYAIAFGVEERWAEVFKSMTIPNPNWYDGGSSATHGFSSTSLATSLGAFSSAFVASSGSGGSASSGGGSVGGGGGGGGGGSW